MRELKRLQIQQVSGAATGATSNPLAVLTAPLAAVLGIVLLPITFPLLANGVRNSTWDPSLKGWFDGLKVIFGGN